MSELCSGITRSGTRCTLSVTGASGFCHLHDPTRAEERRRAASRAGRSKPSRELAGLKAYLEDLAEEVRSGKLEPKIGAVVNQIVNTRLRALEMERALRETDELAAEIAELKREYGAA